MIIKFTNRQTGLLTIGIVLSVIGDLYQLLELKINYTNTSNEGNLNN